MEPNSSGDVVMMLHGNSGRRGQWPSESTMGVMPYGGGGGAGVAVGSGGCVIVVGGGAVVGGEVGIVVVSGMCWQ